MDHIFKTTVAIALKSARPCSSTFSEHNGTKKGAGDRVRAAAAMFESTRLNHTATKRACTFAHQISYICMLGLLQSLDHVYRKVSTDPLKM